MNKKRVNSIFYSLQGEGCNTGRAAVFVRFAFCNLHCAFCDTEFESFHEMSNEEIMAAIASYPARFVVLTGGEPTLQTDESFVDMLHQHGYEVAMESNGTQRPPVNLDWLTVSPKQSHWSYPPEWRQPDEIKIVYPSPAFPAEAVEHLAFPCDWRGTACLQPCDTGQTVQNAKNLRACIAFIKKHPEWRLSLQTHKLIGIE